MFVRIYVEYSYYTINTNYVVEVSFTGIDNDKWMLTINYNCKEPTVIRGEYKAVKRAFDEINNAIEKESEINKANSGSNKDWTELHRF